MGRIEDKIGELAREVADGMGVELVDAELRGAGRRTLLRVTIDREGGVTVGDCERFSKDLGAMLDVEDLLKESYTLEVSSPGLDRPLKGPGDFRRHRGKLVNISLREKVEGRGAWTGRVEDALEDRVRLSVDGKSIEIAYGNILKAVLEIEI
ncbi:MAG: ribosome maturation factor RimP [Nitrospirota bacterium]|jgi:ribosome maturation factor RimP